MRMRRYSHPNMKPGQRKYRKPSALEQWFDTRMWIANATEALTRYREQPDADPATIAEMEQAIRDAEREPTP